MSLKGILVRWKAIIHFILLTHQDGGLGHALLNAREGYEEW